MWADASVQQKVGWYNAGNVMWTEPQSNPSGTDIIRLVLRATASAGRLIRLRFEAVGNAHEEEVRRVAAGCPRRKYISVLALQR